MTSHLTNATGQVIDQHCISISLVRYVVSNFPYGAKDFTCEVSNDEAYLTPDRLEPFERFDLPGQTVRPVGITCQVPVTAAPGNTVVPCISLP